MNKQLKLYNTVLKLDALDRSTVLSNLSSKSLNELYALAYKKSKKRINVLKEIEYKSGATRDLEITKKIASGGLKGAGIGALVGAGGAGTVWAAKRLALRNKYKRCGDLPPEEAVECRKSVEKQIELLAKKAKTRGVLATLGGAAAGGAIGGTKGYVKGMADDDKYSDKLDKRRESIRDNEDSIRSETVSMVRGAINSAYSYLVSAGTSFTRATAMKNAAKAYRELEMATKKLKDVEREMDSLVISSGGWVYALEKQLAVAKEKIRNYERKHMNVEDKTVFDRMEDE